MQPISKTNTWNTNNIELNIYIYVIRQKMGPIYDTPYASEIIIQAQSCRTAPATLGL